MHWNTLDFWLFYANPVCTPIYGAGPQLLTDVYYNIDESLKVIEKLLAYQFLNDSDVIASFITDCFDALERKGSKCNTIVIHSPSNAGKNFFVDCITSYYLGVGHLGFANKSDNFAFQDAYNKRVIVWDEPSYESSALNKIKTLMGGCVTNVKVKQKSNCSVTKTPMFLMTNDKLSLMNCKNFVTRVKQFRWRVCPWLIDYKKKPHPLCTFKLFNKYGLVKDLNET